jgi:hypothetical protein
MIDSTTGKSIRVSSDPVAAPFITLPASQLDAVCKLFEENKVRYWVDHLVISVNDRPAEGLIHLNREMDPKKVQALLDAAA